MTLEQLRIFIAVAERQHVTRAADVLNLTQSAVSSAITTLEARHGVALFDRVGRGIVLNRAGEMFLAEARKVLAQAQAAEAALADLSGLERGRLSIHASQTIASYWLPPRLTRFHEAHPGIEIDVAIGNTAQVARAVAEGDAEIGLVEGLVDDPRSRSRGRRRGAVEPGGRAVPPLGRRVTPRRPRPDADAMGCCANQALAPGRRSSSCWLTVG